MTLKQRIGALENQAVIQTRRWEELENDIDPEEAERLYNEMLGSSTAEPDPEWDDLTPEQAYQKYMDFLHGLTR